MTNKRMGYAVLIRCGDDEISRALADGLSKGQAVLPQDEMSEIDREAHRRAKEDMKRILLHRDRDERYWSNRMFEAEMAYGESLLLPSIPERIEAAWLRAYAMIYAISQMMKQQRRRKRRRARR